MLARRLSLVLVFAWLGLSMTASAMAQARGEQKGATPGRFDYFVLALSWSPTYCADGGEKQSPYQCHVGAANGFVVHGLWPQFELGYPIDCPTDQKDLPKTVLPTAQSLFPDLRLAEHEWRRHGSCTGLEPAQYLAAVADAKAKIVIPAAMTSVKQETSLAPASIAKAFVDANPGLSGADITVSCRKDALQEVRICLAKDAKTYRACPEAERESCRAAMISLLPMR